VSGPRTTICVVPRERFSIALGSLTELVEGLPAPFRIVYVDGGSPKGVRDALGRMAEQHDFTLLRTDHLLIPNEARNLALRRVDTEFVAFVDNDVFLSPGWLPTLEAAADRHGAAVVAPVYGISRDDRAKVVIHIAGADNHIVVEDGRRHYRIDSPDEGADPADVMPHLTPRPTEQAEFHCFFARTEAIHAIAPLDEGLRSMNEHLDATLRIREHGGTIWLEPAVFVTYQIPSRLKWSDLPFHVLRWSRPWNEASIRRFHAAWDIDADDPTSAWLLRQADYTRYRSYRPYRSAMGRIQAYRGRHSRPLPDRVITPVIVRREEARRRRGRPPVVGHRASWDDRTTDEEG
jgi:GT2 family glycosyltransferase